MMVLMLVIGLVLGWLTAMLLFMLAYVHISIKVQAQTLRSVSLSLVESVRDAESDVRIAVEARASNLVDRANDLDLASKNISLRSR